MEDRAVTDVGHDRAVVGVFDGHGGRVVADHAAARVLGAVADAMRRDLAGDAFWRAVFADLDADVALAGSTATVLLVGARRLSVAWVGDSRAILVDEAGHRVLTPDHRIDRAEELRRCLDAGAVLMPPYVMDPATNNGLMMTRALGDRALRRIGITSEPETATVDVGTMDIGFVVATDGLWDIVGGEEAAAVCRAHAPQRAAEQLVETVVERGGADNVTVVAGTF
jgi:protein phosphatase